MKDLYRRLGVPAYMPDGAALRTAAAKAPPADRRDAEAVLLNPARKAAYDRMHRTACMVGELRARLAIDQGKWTEEYRDFTFHRREPNAPRQSAPSARSDVAGIVGAVRIAGKVIGTIWNLTLALIGFGFIAGFLILIVSAVIPGNRSSSSGRSAPSVQQPKFTLPPQALPATGEGEDYQLGSAGRIQVVTSKSGFHTLVKVVDKRTGRTAATRFVRSGGTVSIPVDVGVYVLKTASGRTWYGETALFGPGTQYSIANADFPITSVGDGWAVELILQTDGNLTQSAIPASQF